MESRNTLPLRISNTLKVKIKSFLLIFVLETLTHLQLNGDQTQT
jgi:hypothetical protein